MSSSFAALSAVVRNTELFNACIDTCRRASLSDSSPGAIASRAPNLINEFHVDTRNKTAITGKK